MKEKIQKVAVVGTGSLGTQIAALASCFGCQVFAYDIDADSMNSALENLRTIIKTSRRRPFLSLEDWEKGASQIKFCNELEEALRDSDLVIEAVPEDLELKRKVFKRLDALAPRRAILATNSSSIPISRLETATARPRQCLNLHFYNPARGVNMVDIMGGTRTTAETIAAGHAWVRSIGCVPLTVKKEILGFCFNRIWRTVKREALHMWAEGFVDLKDIDRAWMIFTGMSQGPFGLMDNIGLDVVYDIEAVYYNESMDAGDHPPDALKAMVEQKLLGRKTGKGFYTYPNPEYSSPDFLNG
jgi:3-hydroxybutyryl-CoA dehydrogenase